MENIRKTGLLLTEKAYPTGTASRGSLRFLLCPGLKHQGVRNTSDASSLSIAKADHPVLSFQGDFRPKMDEVSASGEQVPSTSFVNSQNAQCIYQQAQRCATVQVLFECIIGILGGSQVTSSPTHGIRSSHLPSRSTRVSSPESSSPSPADPEPPLARPIEISSLPCAGSPNSPNPKSH